MWDVGSIEVTQTLTNNFPHIVITFVTKEVIKTLFL